MKRARHRNGGLRKRCGCPRKVWPKCAHDWHFNFKPRGGSAWRFSLDVEAGRRIDSKTDAERLAGDIRAAINAGTYVRAADRRKAGAVAANDVLPIEKLGRRTLREVHEQENRQAAVAQRAGTAGI